MKHLTTLATLSLFAVASWAAPAVIPAASSAPSAARMARFQDAACPTPAAAGKKTWKHGQAEYKDLTAAASAKDNAQKAQLAAAFVQKYPDSDYKTMAMQLEMGAQAAMPGQQATAVKTAENLMKAPGADAGQILAAEAIISFLDPTVVQPTDPNLAAKMATLKQAASCGQQMVGSAPAAQQAQYGPIFTKAIGFAELNSKNYDGAISTLTKAIQARPKDALLYYWLGTAEVTKPTPDFNSGIFYLAKASSLAPNAAAIKGYLDKVYTTYHGSTDGEQAVITAADSNTTPPAGFKVQSASDVQYNQAMQQYLAEKAKLAAQLPPADSFVGIEARLKRADHYVAEWKKVKGQGYELDGYIKRITPKTAEIAVGNDATAPADIHLELFTPLKKLPKVGEKVTFSGEVISFKPNPPDPNGNFLMTMDKGTIKGYSPTATPKPAGGF